MTELQVDICLEEPLISNTEVPLSVSTGSVSRIRNASETESRKVPFTFRYPDADSDRMEDESGELNFGDAGRVTVFTDLSRSLFQC